MRSLSIRLVLSIGSALASIVLLLAIPARVHAEPAGKPPAVTQRPLETIRGVVASSQSRWSARRIVTDSVIRTSDGRMITVTQPGGTVDGIGMVQFPGQPVLSRADTVELEIPLVQAGVTGSSPGTPLPIYNVVSLTAARSTGTAAKNTIPGQADFVRTTNGSGAPLFWASNCVFLSYDCEGTTHLPDKDEFVILDQMFQNWRNETKSCGYLDFKIEQPECAETGNDGKNIVKFREQRCNCAPSPDSWCRPAVGSEPQTCYSPDAAALTTLHFINDPDSPRNGEIIDADIEVNGVFFAISAGGTSMGPNGACLSDLANTLTHEAGHFMGLDHTCQAANEPARVDQNGNPVPSCSLGNALPATVREATMYNFQDCGETKKSSPEADDIAAICSIYPTSQDPGECKRASLTKSGGGGCAISGPVTPGLAGLLVLACAALLFVRRRRASS